MNGSSWEIIEALVGSWAFWALVAALGVVLAALATRRWLRLVRSGVFDVDRMTGEEFAECVKCVFEDLGSPVESVQADGERAALLVVTIDGVRTAVRTEYRPVGRVASKAVEEVLVGKDAYNCTDAFVVTNRQFTPRARELALSEGVALHNRDVLATMLLAWQEHEGENEEELDRAA
jgi:restriction system protein